MAGRKGTTRIEVTFSGPFFTPMRGAIMREFLAAAVKRVTELADLELRAAMDRRFKHPTGHFKSQLHTVEVSPFMRTIEDPVVYGNWLEGSSRRNQSTRFKGYKIFRLTRQKMRKIATAIAQAMWDSMYAGRMNGL
jgi:hypothetical protein